MTGTYVTADPAVVVRHLGVPTPHPAPAFPVDGLRVAARSGELRVEPHESMAEIDALVPEWQQLHNASRDTNPFSAPEWPVGWLHHFADERRSRPLVLSVRSGTVLLGVAAMHRRSALGGALRMISPVGIGTPWVMPYELPTLLAAPDAGAAVSRAVVGWLCGNSASWDVARLMLGSASNWLLPQWIPNASHAVLVRRLRADAVIRLAPGEDLYAGRRNLKESLRRARNRLNRDLGEDGWSASYATGRANVSQALQTLFRLHRDRAAMPGVPQHSDALRQPAVRDYLRAVVTSSADADRARIYELRMRNDVIASQLVLRTSAASFVSLSGMTQRAWPYSAITYLQSLAVNDATAAGHHVVHLSVGPNQAKMRWTDAVDMHPEFWLVGPRVRARAAYLAEELGHVVVSLREARADLSNRRGRQVAATIVGGPTSTS